MRNNYCKYRLFLSIAGLLLAISIWGQTDSLPPLPVDTLHPVAFTDSAVVDLSPLRISKQGLDDIINYGALDSMWFDVKSRQLHLWGSAFVNYSSLQIKAGYILMDYEKNEITAQEFPDSSGRLAETPQFNDGQQDFSAGKLRYNFKTKKGIIYEARTKQEDLYVLGAKAKFIGSDSDPSDSTQTTKNVIYNQNALVTTCDAPHPHYGIRTQKLKVIPDKLVVTGFSNLELGGIPTPLVLPFGFYPITKTRKAGLIIPRDFEFAQVEGLGLKNFGWYQPINEHMDASVLFNAYVSGSFGVDLQSQYKYRYHSNGNFSIRYNNRVTENNMAQKVSAKSFGLRWSHNQDANAHPSRKFGGSVNIETNRDQNRNQNDYNSVYRNTLTSNLNYSKTFPGKPYNFSASLNHSQNTLTRQMNISFPNASFNVQRIYPFKRKIPVGKDRWYEKISLVYNARLQNSFQTPDTLLFTKQTLQNAKMGIQHQANTDFNFKLFKYINVAPRINYEENWYPFHIEKELLNRINFVYDTTFENLIPVDVRVDSARTEWGVDTTYRIYGFNAFRKFDVGISANTALFFTKQYKNGWFRGIRHTVKPSASIGIGPDYSRYFRTIDTDLRGGTYNDQLEYSIYDEGILGRPSNSNRDLILNYSIGNVLEMKYFSAKRDTVLRKKIFDNLTFSGNFNFSADTLRWSSVNTGGVFRLFKGVTTLTWNTTFDPYLLSEKGKRIDKFVLKEEGKLVRVSRFSVQFNTSGSLQQIRDVFQKKDEKAIAAAPKPQAPSDELWNWMSDFRVSHRFSIDRVNVGGTNRDTLLIGTNNITLNGSIPISANWQIDINNIGYDFRAKSLAYPDIGFTRDLHCWQLSMRWQPQRGTYEVFLGVKPGSSLDFLKMPYRKNNVDSKARF